MRFISQAPFFSPSRYLGLYSTLLFLEEFGYFCLKPFPTEGAVLPLHPPFSGGGDKPGREMPHAHSGLAFVAVLTARPADSKKLDNDIRLFDQSGLR